MDKPRALTYRQSKFVAAVLQGRSYAQAAREAGYSESVANCAGLKIAGKPGVQVALKTAEAQVPTAQTFDLTDAEKRLLMSFNRLPHWPRFFIQSMVSSLAAEDWQRGLALIDMLAVMYRSKQ